jgi:transcriptional regulator with XRE-family HTH domain
VPRHFSCKFRFPIQAPILYRLADVGRRELDRPGLLGFRRERGLSHAAFARRLGVDPGTLSRWERNLRVPAGTYASLAETFCSAAPVKGPPEPDRDLSTVPQTSEGLGDRLPVASSPKHSRDRLIVYWWSVSRIRADASNRALARTDSEGRLFKA